MKPLTKGSEEWDFEVRKGVVFGEGTRYTCPLISVCSFVYKVHEDHFERNPIALLIELPMLVNPWRNRSLVFLSLEIDKRKNECHFVSYVKEGEGSNYKRHTSWFHH